jgi:bifunctional ADP-heptose synthase (sugar kinase/adenylyltransferase)
MIENGPKKEIPTAGGINKGVLDFATGRGREEAVDQLRGVRFCLDYLSRLAKHPEQRTTRVSIVSEPILDVFYSDVTTRKGREGVSEELVVMGKPSFNLGGGANIVRGLSNFAREVQVITRVGDAWPYAEVMQQQLEALPANVSLHLIRDSNSSDAVKVRYVDRLGRVRHVTNYQPLPLSESVEQKIINAIRGGMEDDYRIIVSDYGRGMMTKPVFDALDTVGHDNLHTILIDPRPTTSALQNQKFNITNAIPTPNREEAELLSGVQIVGETFEEVQTSVLTAAAAILGRFDKLAGVLITCDKDGAFYVSRSGESIYVAAAIDSKWLINPSGAGDIVISTLALLPEEFPLDYRIRTAMYLAGTSVTYPHTSTLDKELVEVVKKRVEIIRWYRMTTQ